MTPPNAMSTTSYMVARPPNGIERRRTIRIRRSSLLDAKLESLDRPSIKKAETFEEYSQAFTLLHDAYLASGYLPQAHPERLYFGIHHLLPETCVFLFKSYRTVLSTMSFIPDSPEFGLPMDDLYKSEVDVLRRAGRKVVEIGSLATVAHRRGQNIIMFLAKAMFQFAISTGTDDVCITVNPKHTRFYKSIFLFEPFGEKRYYDKVGAPAVALRVDMRSIKPSLRDAYGESDFDTDVYSLLVQKDNVHARATGLDTLSLEKCKPLVCETLAKLLALRSTVLEGLTNRQFAAFQQYYKDCDIVID